MTRTHRDRTLVVLGLVLLVIATERLVNMIMIVAIRLDRDR